MWRTVLTWALGVVLLLGGAWFVVFKIDPFLLPLKLSVDLPMRIRGFFDQALARFLPAAPPEDVPPPAVDVTSSAVDAPVEEANLVTLYLKNGGMVSGTLVEETPEALTLRWDYGDVVFHRTEISAIKRGRQLEGEEDVVLPPIDNGDASIVP